MSIIVKDETANAVVLTIDNNGNMAFGDGTPISLVSIGGYGIIDSNGHIQHGLVSCSPSPSSGTVTCGIGTPATVTTASGLIPIVQLDTGVATTYTFEYRDPSDPSAGGTESATPKIGFPRNVISPTAGSFTITCNDSADGTLTDPSSPNYDPNLSQAQCGYRWL